MCCFCVYQRARVAKKFETAANIVCFYNIEDKDKEIVQKHISEFNSSKSPGKEKRVRPVRKVTVQANFWLQLNLQVWFSILSVYYNRVYS